MDKKRDSIRRKRKKCEVCQSKEDLHVHHLTYENLYNEKDEDLILVCKSCHFSIHKGYFIIINDKGYKYYKDKLVINLLDSLKGSKIKLLYFQKDKSLIMKGELIPTNMKLDEEKWYFLKEGE